MMARGRATDAFLLIVVLLWLLLRSRGDGEVTEPEYMPTKSNLEKKPSILCISLLAFSLALVTLNRNLVTGQKPVVLDLSYLQS